MADANRFEVQLTDYLQAVVRRHGLLNLGSFQERHERQVKTVRLDQIYVPLRLAGSHPWEEGEERGARPGKTGDDLLSNQLLLPRRRLGRHLVVLGDAGSGKTTILRHLTVSLADAWLGQDAAVAAQQTGFQDGLAEMPWPLFVPLRHFEHFCQANNHGLTWGSFLQFLPEHFGQLYNVVVDPAFYRQLLQSGRCLLALDGFDEISDMNVRHQAVEMVHTLANGQQTGRNHIILSSRVAAYGGPAQLGMDFRTVWVQNLNREERQTQVEKWVEEVSASTGRGLQAGDILERMPEGSALDELAVTPMIVTTLCVVYFYDHELPEQRALLYRRCVDIMLDEGLRRDAAGRVLAQRTGSLVVKRKRLAQLAFHLHRSGKENADRRQAMAWLHSSFRHITDEEEKEAAIADFLDGIVDRGTLLQERLGRFGFGRQHLTFQEYLAGQHLILALPPSDRGALWPELLPDDRWREPIRLAVGATATEATQLCEFFIAEMLAAADETGTVAARLAGYRLAAEALGDAGSVARQEFMDPDLQRRVRGELALRLTEPGIVDPAAGLLTARVLAAQALGRLGDPRPGVATLPPELTPIISGGFLFGEEKEPRTAAPFRASLYPITNAQFAQFMTAGGYERPDWWDEAGQNWLANPPSYRQRPVRQPEYWDNRRFNQLNQPVVGVSYYEAEAFCRWLSAIDEKGLQYRLPTEEEWEALARGPQGREYPWGNEWQEGVSNTEEAGLDATCGVGLFPGDKSPHGAHDCAGNVWEWCVDWIDEQKRYKRVKGGTWAWGKGYARCGARFNYNPDRSSDGYGLRVVAPIS